MTKDCCDEKNMKDQKKSGVDPIIMGIIAFSILLVGGALYFGSKLGATTVVEADKSVQIVVGDNSHNWGDIDINGGIVSKVFAIENTSDSVLKLYDVKTSCMCTTAQLRTSSESSKKFGMHEKTSSVFEVQPGDTVEVVVEFDPLFHGPSGVGPINRTVTMNTNDSSQTQLSFQLAANVVKQ